MLSAFSLYLIFELRASKKVHLVKVKSLENMIFNLLEEGKKQSSNLKLSDELKTKLTEARSALDEDLMEFQYDLLSEIYKK